MNQTHNNEKIFFPFAIKINVMTEGSGYTLKTLCNSYDSNKYLLLEI